MSIIDNDAQTMHEALINALTSVDRVDIEVAFFYFSGWELIAKHLQDKKSTDSCRKIYRSKMLFPSFYPG